MYKCKCKKPEVVNAPIEPFFCHKCGGVLPEMWHELEKPKPCPDSYKIDQGGYERTRR
ncbi:MAG: hypothetical protein ACTSUF_10190 [Candidatus Heimdallarchaeaceae archaeon]